MSTRECTDVGEDYREGKRERGRPTRMKAGLGQQATGGNRQTGCKPGRRVSADGREAAQEAGRTAFGRGPPTGLGAGAVWQAGWGSGGRRAAQSTAEAGEGRRLAGGSGDWSRRPRGSRGEVDPAPGRLHAEVAGLAFTQGKSSRTERGQRPAQVPSGARGCSLSRGLVGPASRQARAADPWIRACLEGTQRVVF